VKQLTWSLLFITTFAFAAQQDNGTSATTAVPATTAATATTAAPAAPAAAAATAAPAAPATTVSVAETTAPLLPGDAARGQTKIQTCVACHGEDGNSVIPNYPKIAGQEESYLIQSLQEFKKGPNGQRNSPVMYGMAAPLSEQDILDLAAYYSQQKKTIGQADPTLVALGARIYRGGNVDANVPACIACHGPKGEGNALAKFPALSGQNAAYVVEQLHAFRSKTRGGGVNDMMTDVVQRMSEEEINAVASYISGLH
jgi:cytochrome c553